MAEETPEVTALPANESATHTPTPKKRRQKKSKSATPSAAVMKRDRSKSSTKTPLLAHPRFEKLTPRPTRQFDDDGTELWCICNKPDNGTLMLGCDGCDSWFHARCVKISEKYGNLISKFYCPYCELDGKGVILWKRKCRLEQCFEPIEGSNSKYCGKAHGIQFMTQTLQELKAKASMKQEDEDDDDRQNLSKSQITQIINHTTSYDHFVKLGQTLPNAPIDITKDPRIVQAHTTLWQTAKQIEWLTKKKAMLNKTRESVKKINEEITNAMNINVSNKKKIKKLEVCGFDPILSENAEFFESFMEDQLGSSKITDLKDHFIRHLQSHDSDGDIDMDDFTPPICLLEKKKCPKHTGWQSMVNDQVEMDARSVELNQKKAHDANERLTKVLNVDYFEQQALKNM